MKLVIDLQSVQSESRHRGIGRYSAAISHAVAEAAQGKHDIWIAANARLGHIEHIRALFDGLIPQDRIVAFDIVGPTASMDPRNEKRRNMSELLREDLLRRLDPDVIWTTSLFEGWVDDAVTSIGQLSKRALHAVTLYDLIPLANSTEHLRNDDVKRWYYRKLAYLKRADILLAISNFAREEAMGLLNVLAEGVVNVSTAVNERFRRLDLSPADVRRIMVELSIKRPFVLYVGGFDDRKNVALLVKAYAGLPVDIRNRHALVLGGRITDRQRDALKALAHDLGLSEGNVTFTGHLTDNELIALYNICELFAFPSLQEGFGLPVLEAMACGAPVLAAKTTSLPEVVGSEEMLFDPSNPRELSRRMATILSRPDMRSDFIRHGLHQASRFSWQHSADLVLRTFETMLAKQEKVSRGKSSPTVSYPPRLAYVSPLPPERTGIADYSAELLEELGRYYDIEVVVNQASVSDDWVLSNYPVRDSEWFKQNAWRFDRILYHFGNSSFHDYQIPLMREHPGTVVLHDLFLGAFSAWRASASGCESDYLLRLYKAHGFGALQFDATRGREASKARYPSSLEILQLANGTLVHSQYAINCARRFYGDHAAASMQRVPFAKRRRSVDRAAARNRFELNEDDFIVCSFGIMAPTKLNERLLSAWLNSDLAANSRCYLVFVGENHGGSYGAALSKQITLHSAGKRIRITGFAQDDEYHAWLAAADLAVQLRTESRGETSAAVFDCMAQGLPLIVNAHATFAELDDKSVMKLPDEFSEEQLTDALLQMYGSAELRHDFALSARRDVDALHHPSKVALGYRDAIEMFANTSDFACEEEVAVVASRFSDTHSEDLLDMSVAMSRNRLPYRLRQLLVDVTAIAKNDLKTGIERVTRSTLLEWLRVDWPDIRIEPVRFCEGRYVYAREYAFGLLDTSNPGLNDEPVEVAPGDIFLGLDWVADVVPSLSGLFQSWRDRNVRVYFAVYDLLPVLKPHAFPAGTDQMHAAWLRAIAGCADGLCCISKTVAGELRSWLDDQAIDRERPLDIGYWHLGAELVRATRHEALTAEAQSLLDRFNVESTVLMVGTVEPRKGHAIALDAFDFLWARGSPINLVVIGKQGWMTEALAARIRNHGEFGKRLHWLSGISDEYLQQVYESVDVLLAASEGEGFGLPLIEAAQYGVPVIARDLPVFTEVMGGHATYFSSAEGAKGLVSTIEEWFARNVEGTLPSVGLNWLSWRESAEILAALLTDDKHPQWIHTWLPEGMREKQEPFVPVQSRSMKPLDMAQ